MKVVFHSCALEEIFKPFPNISWRAEKFVELLDHQKEIRCCCISLGSPGSNQIWWMCKTWAEFSITATILYPLLNALLCTWHVASIAVWLTTVVLDVNWILLQEKEYDFSYSQPNVTFNRHKICEPLKLSRS